MNSSKMPDFLQLPRHVAAGGRLAIMVAFINIIHDIHVWTTHTVAGKRVYSNILNPHQLLLPFNSWRCIFVGRRTSLCVGFEPCFKSGLRVHQDPTLTNDTCQSTAWTPSRTSIPYMSTRMWHMQSCSIGEEWWFSIASFVQKNRWSSMSMSSA